MVSKTEQVIISESIKRMTRNVEEEIRSGKIIMLTDAPEHVRDIMEPMAAFIGAMIRIAVSAKWN